jgi:hypothetical protein
MALDQPVEGSSRAQSAGEARGRGHELSAVLILSGIVLLTVVVHYVLALEQTAPWLMGDELRYAEMAKSFLEHGSLLFREAPSSFATAYPALIAPAWAAADIDTAYEIAKAINVVLMTSSAAIVFFWTRRLAPTPYALAAGGLVLLMPTFAYTGMLLMENAALPAFRPGSGDACAAGDAGHRLSDRDRPRCGLRAKSGRAGCPAVARAIHPELRDPRSRGDCVCRLQGALGIGTDERPRRILDRRRRGLRRGTGCPLVPLARG